MKGFTTDPRTKAEELVNNLVDSHLDDFDFDEAMEDYVDCYMPTDTEIIDVIREKVERWLDDNIDFNSMIEKRVEEMIDLYMEEL